ncbi:MAG: 23S rRNA (adenine(2503)-C(2))-methyltransferase RlmN [Bacteroidia bacterium]|nr:23S rRNA (adenine(2503)-C(2))-methyltransferase RlmN [Bacteroidia bacterium]
MPVADILKCTLADIKQFFGKHQQPDFRAKQVYEWLWKKQVRSFNSMTNLSKETRQLLNEHFVINAIREDYVQKSADGTIKMAFRLFDGNRVEGVLIPHGKRMTACISSQAGCSLTCRFCATGKLGRIRNLDAAEIFDQVVLIRNKAVEHYNSPLTNIVYMGMGEPLLNYREVAQSVHQITASEGLGMSPQRITVSTAGIAKMIRKLGDDEVKFNLALSLHAANDAKRSQIMPINDQNNLQALRESLLYFFEKTGTRITFEYILFDSFNDSIKDAQELVAFAKGIPCKINLIEYNTVEGTGFKKSKAEKVRSFKLYLEEKGKLIANVRRSRGKDIDAACGQLAGKN